MKAKPSKKEATITERKPGKKTQPIPESKHVPAETKEQRKARYTQFVKDNKATMTELEMSLALGISLESLERVILRRPPEGITAAQYLGVPATTRKREKGVYSNSHVSDICREFWEEPDKLNPAKEPTPGDE